MDDTEQAQLLEVVDAADGAMRAHGWMPTRTIVLTEIIDETGEREVVIGISRDLRAQDALGLLDYAITREHAGLVRAMAAEDDDD